MKTFNFSEALSFLMSDMPVIDSKNRLFVKKNGKYYYYPFHDQAGKKKRSRLRVYAFTIDMIEDTGWHLKE